MSTKSVDRMVTTVGIDIGSQKTMIVADDAEIVLTSTGSIARPTLVAFFGNSRLVGEEAAPQISGDSTIAMINLLIGRTVETIESSAITPHRKVSITSDDKGRLLANVNYCDEQRQVYITSLMGIFLANLHRRICEVYGPSMKLAFALPPGHSNSVSRAVREACSIADIDLNNVFTVDASDSLVATYQRKLQALKGPERAGLEGKKSVLIEMGHTQTTVVVVEITAAASTVPVPVKVGFAHDAALGAHYFDLKLFEHFSEVCEKKYGGKVAPGSKRGLRLLQGCERIRKLLSQLPESHITVENMSDNGDVNFTLLRDELATYCGDLLGRFKNVIRTALTSAGITEEKPFGSSVAAVEVLGGGVRMQVVQAAILEVLGETTVLGAKFDDASVALGAALQVNKFVDAIAAEEEIVGTTVSCAASAAVVAASGDDGSIGLEADELAIARQLEIEMQAKDEEIKIILAARNALESYILEMRSAPRRKFGNTIDSAALNKVLDEVEGWLWDTPEAALDVLTEKSVTVRAEVSTLCAEYFRKTEEDRQAVEAALAEEAAKAEAERAANGEDEEEDHDTRKLRKADRMRLVVKNKEEGTELFKGSNFRPAAARYHKALTHIAKFFDLGPDDEAEVKNLKITLYLNLASCYIKMENWEQVLRNCTDALALDDRNAKAYFRRSLAYEAKKEWQQALADVKKAQELMDTEDKMVSKTAERIKKEIQREKDKEKKMWGKAFSS